MIIEINVTCKNDTESKSISKILLKNKLIACANFSKVKSMYWWNNKICEDNESLLILKSTKNKVDSIKKIIINNHSYTLPVITVKNIKVDKQVKDWIHNSIK